MISLLTSDHICNYHKLVRLYHNLFQGYKNDIYIDFANISIVDVVKFHHNSTFMFRFLNLISTEIVIKILMVEKSEIANSL